MQQGDDVNDLDPDPRPSKLIDQGFSHESRSLRRCLPEFQDK